MKGLTACFVDGLAWATRHFVVLAAVSIAGGCAVSGMRQPYNMPHVAHQGTAGAMVPILRASLWNDAPWTPLFGGAISEKGSPPAIPDLWQTRAKFTWDAQQLFVLVESVGPPPSSPFHHHDELLYQADVVELFLDVTGDRQRIIELEINPRNVTTDYLHIWRQPPRYPADRIDVAFYRANHRADLAWNLKGLRTRSILKALDDGRVRWTVMMAVPLANALAAERRPPELHAGQPLYVNLMRYAYAGDGGHKTFRQYNLVPVRPGCPHQSPMAVMRLIVTK